MKRELTLLLLLCVMFSVAQKQALTHDDYDLWKRVSTTKISDNGKVSAISVVTSTGAGDGYLEIHNLDTGSKTAFFNGVSPHISPDEKYVYFLKKPAYEKSRQEKKDDVKKDKQSKNTFMVYDVQQETCCRLHRPQHKEVCLPLLQALHCQTFPYLMERRRYRCLRSSRQALRPSKNRYKQHQEITLLNPKVQGPHQQSLLLPV